MVSIYKLMEKDWKVYCLMSGIILIEEMSKPTSYIDKEGYQCHHSIILRMKDKDTVYKLHNITKKWESKKNIQLTGKSFKIPKEHKNNGQYSLGFSPTWLFEIIKTTKGLPSRHTFNIALERIQNWKKLNNQQEIKKIIGAKSDYSLLLKNKYLAASAFIVSMDMEFRGIQLGRPNLCMSKTYKDFLEFMLQVANHYNWSATSFLKKVDVSYSRKLGIKATDQYDFNLKMASLKEIYNLAGPLLDKGKDKGIKHHIRRSTSYINIGSNFIKRNTRKKILDLVLKYGKTTTTELQYHVNVGIDVILDHLHKLHKDGHITKKRQGKRYIWSSINGNKSKL